MKGTSLECLIRKHTYANAYIHEGKAETSAVISKVMAEEPTIRLKIKELLPTINSIIHEVNNMSKETQYRHIEEEFPELLEKHEKIIEERKLPPLPNAKEGFVVTRFPPEPNGYLHLGHAKAIVIDSTYAKMYKGKMLLRFDDTNPLKEQLEYYDAIRESINWLGIKPDFEKNSSDDMEIYYKYAQQIINSGNAYVCTCQHDIIKQNRLQGKACSCRSLSIQDHHLRWIKMFNEYKMSDAILRLKGDIANVNSAMRDPTFFRIIDTTHPLKGDKYRVWPTYDFSAPIEDSLDGITHALRTKEYELRDELYFHILKLLNLRKPELIEFSRLEIKDTTISKRKLHPLIQEGLVKGWDDPRLPTLSGLKRRGFLPESIIEFVLSLGVTKTESEPDWSLIESINKKKLDTTVKRFFFVPEPVKLEVLEAPTIKTTLKHHPSKDFGERVIETKGMFYISLEDVKQLKNEEMIRLLGLYNVKIESSNDSKVIGRYAGNEIKKDVSKVQWVTEKNEKFSVWIMGSLLENGIFNKNSLKIVKGFAEHACRNLIPGEMIQFIRFGFCRIDSPNVAILTHN